MSVNSEDNRKKLSKFTSDEIMMALKLVESMETVVELMFHLMENEGSESFVLMLLSANKIDVHKIANEQKRKTDMLFEVNASENLYAMLCQDTQVDGGYHFGQRLIKTMKEADGQEIYCCALEVRSTRVVPKSIFFKLIEMFIKSQEEHRVDEVIYKSLN